MTSERKNDHQPRRPSLLFRTVMVFILIIGGVFVLYRPDRPVATIIPGSSDGPTYVVQIIRPRSGLPLGGLVPPRVFGLESHLGFDSATPEATIGTVSPHRIELCAKDWDMVLVIDSLGRVKADSYIVFELEFEGRRRRVRCHPGDPASGKFTAIELGESNQISGHFNIELGRCEDAESGDPLGWPSQPLILRGSFDQLVQKQ